MVVVNFPFTGASGAKRRPALVLAVPGRSDSILCQITSQIYSFDPHAIPLDNADFTSGGMNHPSRIRPDQIFTIDACAIFYKAGHIRAAKLDETLSALLTILRGPVH